MKKMSYRNWVIASLLAMNLCGCASIWHDLKPHRLRRLNRTQAPSLDPEFTQSRIDTGLRLVRNDNIAPPIVLANKATTGDSIQPK